MADINDRVLRLEKIYHRVFAGLVVAAVLIAGFLGITIIQMPKKIAGYVEGEMPGFEGQLKKFLRESEQAVTEANENAESASDIVQQLQALLNTWEAEETWLQVGQVLAYEKSIPSLVKPPPRKPSGECRRWSEPRGMRGQINKRVDFEQPFKSEPHVVMALSVLDVSGSKGMRVRAHVESVDNEGFTYSLHTWCNTKVHSVRAVWVAIRK